MFSQLRHRLRQTAQRFALGGLGAFILLIGFTFLSAAFFLFLTTITDAVTACLLMGLSYAGLGLILMAFARTTPVPDQHAQKNPDLPPLAAAFMQGVAQGTAVRKH